MLYPSDPAKKPPLRIGLAIGIATLTRIKKFGPSYFCLLSTSSTTPKRLLTMQLLGRRCQKVPPYLYPQRNWIKLDITRRHTQLPLDQHQNLIIKSPWSASKNPIHIKFLLNLELEKVWPNFHYLYSVLQTPHSLRCILCSSFVERFTCKKFSNQALRTTFNHFLPSFIWNRYDFFLVGGQFHVFQDVGHVVSHNSRTQNQIK